MFRFFILSFSIFMSVSAQAQQSLDISFSMNDFKVITNDGLSAIITTLKERRVCGDSISPDLPYFFYRIPLQQGQENVSVNVSFTDSLLSENINIVSNPKPSTRNGKSPKEDFNRIATRSVESPLHYSGIKYQNGEWLYSSGTYHTLVRYYGVRTRHWCEACETYFSCQRSYEWDAPCAHRWGRFCHAP